VTTRYVVVPQWQGSASDRAMSLADGAEAIAGDLPAGATIRIDVPLEAGDTEGTGVLRHSSLRLVRERFARAMEGSDEPVAVIGGDASVAYPAIARASALWPDLVVLWCDAHPGALDVATSDTGAFSGMTARALVEDGVIAPDRLVLVGTRAWTGAERGWVDENGVGVVPPAEISELSEHLPPSGAIFVHVGLDVLDPAVLEAVPTLEPFGLALDALLGAIRTSLEGRTSAGSSIAGFAPRSIESAADDLATVLRILGALRSAPSSPSAATE